MSWQRIAIILLAAGWLTLGIARADKPEDSAPEAESPNLIAELAEQFYRREKYEVPAISPGGKLVVALESVDAVRQIVIIDPINALKMPVIREENVYTFAALVINRVAWADDRHVVFTYSVGAVDRMGLIEVLTKEGVPYDVKVSLLNDNWYLHDPLPNYENKIIVIRVVDGLHSMHVVDVTEPKGATDGAQNIRFQTMIRRTNNWLSDRSGRVRIATELDDKKHKKILWFRRTTSDKWREIWRGEPSTRMIPLLVRDDDRTIVAISNEQSDHAVVVEYDVKEKAYGELIFDEQGKDVESASVDPTKTQVFRVTYAEDGVVRHEYIDDKYEFLYSELDDKLYGATPYIIDLSQDERYAIVQTSTNADPGSLYLFDSQEKVSYLFGRLRPWVDRFRIGSTRVVRTTTADGLEIESYLTMPDSESYPRPPLIVMPHGGPISVRDTRHFDGSAQLLATLGYAVLQTNFRGSSGYGRAFAEKGMGQWGRLIEEDIRQSVESVLQLDLVDSDKICVFGSSYGGYSSLISVVDEPAPYRCAASYAGVSDMTLLFHEFRINRSNIIRKFVERMVGNPDEDIDSLVAFSPAYHADKISVPVFLAHGDKDEVVDIEHYHRMKRVLEFFEKDAEFLVLTGEKHGFSKLQSVRSFMSRLDAFFRRALDLEPASAEKMLKAGSSWPEGVSSSGE